MPNVVLTITGITAVFKAKLYIKKQKATSYMRGHAIPYVYTRHGLDKWPNVQAAVASISIMCALGLDGPRATRKLN
jgi:hypothetical protein